MVAGALVVNGCGGCEEVVAKLPALCVAMEDVVAWVMPVVDSIGTVVEVPTFLG